MLARGYHLNSNFDAAINEYKAQLAVLTPEELQESKKEIEKYIAECTTSKELVEKPARAFVDNVGKVINSDYNDHSPLISADESMMIFTSTRNTGHEIGNRWTIDEDIYISYSNNKSWSLLISIGEPIKHPV
jgi:hypothetical protein